MIEQRMLVVDSPPGATFIVDFDLDHRLDAINDSWDPDLLFLLSRCLLHKTLLSQEISRCDRLIVTSLSLGRCQRGRKDSRIGAATTEVSFARFANVLKIRVGILLQVSRNRREEARCAESTHQSILLYEGVLHCVRLFSRSQPFHCGDLLAHSINGQHQTGIDWLVLQ